jgi:hypothetical protein
MRLVLLATTSNQLECCCHWQQLLHQLQVLCLPMRCTATPLPAWSTAALTASWGSDRPADVASSAHCCTASFRAVGAGCHDSGPCGTAQVHAALASASSVRSIVGWSLHIWQPLKQPLIIRVMQHPMNPMMRHAETVWQTLPYPAVVASGSCHSTWAAAVTHHAGCSCCHLCTSSAHVRTCGRQSPIHRGAALMTPTPLPWRYGSSCRGKAQSCRVHNRSL